MKRAALYARVSTTSQEERGTIASQVSALRQQITQDGCHLDPAYEFVDDGVSGTYLARPGLDRLRDLASERVFDVLYVLSPDRLARRYAHQCIVLEELARWGLEVVFLNQPASDRPEDRMMIQMMGVLAEYERELIRDRARRGRLYRARQGQVLTTTPAYGYRYVPVSRPGGGRWEINESEAAIVRRIYQWCVEERLSSYTIARRLNGEEQGYERVSPRKGQHWAYTTVNRILRRPDYTGTAYYNRTCKDPSRLIGQPKTHGRGLRKTHGFIERDRKEWIPVDVPQIVPAVLWEQAQVQLEMNQRFAPRNNKRHFYLLRGLLVCGECSRTLAGRTYPNGTMRYVCSNQTGRCYLPKPCSCPRVDGNVAESLVWQAITELLTAPQLILDYYLARQDGNIVAPHELQRVRQELSQIKGQKQRLLDAYLAEVIELDEFETRRQVIDQQRQALEQRQADLEQLAEQKAHQKAMASDVARFCENIQSMLESPTPEEQQQVLRLVVDHILVEKEQLIVKHVIPLTEDRRLHTQRPATGILPGRASLVTAGCGAPGTSVSFIPTSSMQPVERQGWQRPREVVVATASTKAVEGLDCAVWLTATCGSRREPLINVVKENKPKVLGCLGQPNPLTGIHRLGPKGKGPGMGAPNSPTADIALPAERRNLTCAGTCTERGKPIDLPVAMATWESEPQGELMGLRVEDGGRSECLPVMGRIGVEPGGCTVSATEGVHHPTRKWADFLSRSLVTKTFGEPPSRGKANDGGLWPSWCAL